MKSECPIHSVAFAVPFGFHSGAETAKCGCRVEWCNGTVKWTEGGVMHLKFRCSLHGDQMVTVDKSSAKFHGFKIASCGCKVTLDLDSYGYQILDRYNTISSVLFRTGSDKPNIAETKHDNCFSCGQRLAMHRATDKRCPSTGMSADPGDGCGFHSVNCYHGPGVPAGRGGSGPAPFSEPCEMTVRALHMVGGGGSGGQKYATESVPRVFNKYQKEVKDIDGKVIGHIDVYSVLSAFNVTEPGLQHAIKKLLMPGQRGKGGFKADLKEAVQAIERTIITAQEAKQCPLKSSEN